MSNATQLFHSRDLIKYLPDLLDGDDPILKRPEAKNVLRTDPLAESALMAVGRAVNTYRLGRKDRLRPARKVVGSIEVARPILTAVDCLTRQLADVLADHATYLLTVGIGETWNSHSDRSEYSVDNYESRLREVTELAAVYDTPLPWTPPDPELGDINAALTNSANLLRSVGQLSPHRDPELVKLYLLLLESLRCESVGGTHWLRFASTCSSSAVHTLALHHAARSFVLTGDMNLASTACIDATWLHKPDTVELYLSMTSCAWAGDARHGTRFAAALAEQSNTTRIADQIRDDRDEWGACFNKYPSVVREVATALPEGLSAAIQEAVGR